MVDLSNFGSKFDRKMFVAPIVGKNRNFAIFASERTNFTYYPSGNVYFEYVKYTRIKHLYYDDE